MAQHPDGRILTVGSEAPRIADTAWIAPGAVVAGLVTVADDASVWYGAVLRSELAEITVGARSNIQDNSSCHADTGFPLRIGADVSVGHNAVLHGCTVEDTVLIGMHATVMNGAVIGTQSLVAAGALVTEGTLVPPRSLVAGVPARVRRRLTDDEVERLSANALTYLEHTRSHRNARPQSA